MIKSYMKNSKKLYEIYVAERDSNKKLIAKRKRGINSEREAKEIEFQFKNELRLISNPKNNLTWGDWHDSFIKRVEFSFKKSTLATYNGYLKKWIPPVWLKKPICLITKEDIYKALELSSIKLGLISQRNILKMMRRIFQTAVDEGLIERNPAIGIIVKVPVIIQKVLSARETDLLLENAKSVKHKFYNIWAFALMTGMRSGELYALKWCDIDLDSALISVNKQWTNKDGYHELKTGDWRVVPISSDLKNLLNELRLSGNSQTEFVLPHLKEWTHGDQAKVIRDFCESIGITSIKFHDLRATFITNMLAQGVPLVKVMAIVGHKKMETTDVYLRLAGVDIKGTTNLLGYSLPTANSSENIIAVNFGKKS